MLNQKGFSLAELVIMILLLGVMVFLLANIPNALNLVSKSKHISLAREIASKQIEDKRSLSYGSLVNDSSPISDPRMSLLPLSSGTVDVDDCDAQICTNDEHIKQVTVTINWKDNNKNQTVVLKTLIGEGGLNQ